MFFRSRQAKHEKDSHSLDNFLSASNMTDSVDLYNQLAYRQFNIREKIRAGILYTGLERETYEMLVKHKLCLTDFKIVFFSSWVGWHQLQCRPIHPIVTPSRDLPYLGEFNHDVQAYHCMIIFAGNQKQLDIACNEVKRVMDEHRKSHENIHPPLIIVASRENVSLDIHAIKSLPIVDYMKFSSSSLPNFKNEVVAKLENLMKALQPEDEKTDCFVM